MFRDMNEQEYPYPISVDPPDPRHLRSYPVDAQ